MIAVETFLAIHPPPPRKETMWGFMRRGHIDTTPWQSKTTEEVLRDLKAAIAALPPPPQPRYRWAWEMRP